MSIFGDFSIRYFVLAVTPKTINFFLFRFLRSSTFFLLFTWAPIMTIFDHSKVTIKAILTLLTILTILVIMVKINMVGYLVIIGVNKKNRNKLGLSCAKLSLTSAKLHTSLSSDQLKLATN